MTAPKFNHYYYAATPLLLALTGCAHITPQQGTQEIAAETAIYAAMASNAYRHPESRSSPCKVQAGIALTCKAKQQSNSYRITR